MNDLAALDRRYVTFVFRAARHVPVLVSGYAPELEPLAAGATAEPLPPVEALAEEGRRLVADCAGVEDPLATFISQEVEAELAQLEVAGGAGIAYRDLCSRMLDCDVAPIPDAQLSLLFERALACAGEALGTPTPEAVAAWEAAGLTGDEKVKAATELVDELRERCAYRFPFVPECGVELAVTDDPLVSAGAFYFGRARNRIDVNPDLPRPRAVLEFEIAHNVLPGDAFHLAAVEEAYLRDRGLLSGGIKVKNTPDNVVCEGIEDLALEFALDGTAPPEVALALALEELRRACAANAAIALRQDHRPEAEAVDLLATRGLMSADRVKQTLGLIRHPLWGTYVFTYWAGRQLVKPAWEAARQAGTEPEFFERLYRHLLTPTLFLQAAERCDPVGP